MRKRLVSAAPVHLRSSRLPGSRRTGAVAACEGGGGRWLLAAGCCYLRSPPPRRYPSAGFRQRGTVLCAVVLAAGYIWACSGKAGGGRVSGPGSTICRRWHVSGRFAQRAACAAVSRAAARRSLAIQPHQSLRKRRQDCCCSRRLLGVSRVAPKGPADGKGDGDGAVVRMLCDICCRCLCAEGMSGD